mgnify:CR=1 FL=1
MRTRMIVIVVTVMFLFVVGGKPLRVGRGLRTVATGAIPPSRSHGGYSQQRNQ